MLCVAVRHSAFQRVTALCRRCSAAVCALQCVAVLFTPVCVFHVSHIHSKVTFISPVTNVRESRIRSYQVTRQEQAQRIAPLHLFATVCNILNLKIPRLTFWGFPNVKYIYRVSSHTQLSQITHAEACHTRLGHVTHAWVMSHMNESCAIQAHERATSTPVHFPLRLLRDKHVRKPISASWQIC